jgi:DNA-binding response OmpR family regulator
MYRIGCEIETDSVDRRLDGGMHDVKQWRIGSPVSSAVALMTAVLIVDDDPSIGAAINTLLHFRGYRTTYAADASVGTDAFNRFCFDLVVADIFMPGENGLSMISRFHRASPSIPIIAISGLRFRADGPRLDFLTMARKLGAASVLRKPFSPIELMLAIDACLIQGAALDRPAQSKP